jgi:thiol:disulfide interchange protein DsbD
MKRIFLIISGILAFGHAPGQVQWKFSSEKLTDSTFDIHLTANIEKGWHLYSQLQPPEAIADPSTIKFDTSTALQFMGIVKEIGTREVYENKEIGIKSYQYKSYVDFIQTIKLKTSGKTMVSGYISFMMCTESACLPTITKSFSLPIR